MKHITKLPWLLIMMLVLSVSAFAQTTEDFETDIVGATTFTDNGQTFTITNGAGETNYDIETFAGGGWNGTGPDNNFIDNSGTPTPTLGNGSSFTITTSGSTDIYVNSLYLFMSQFNLTAATSFSVTIQGRKNGVLQYTITKSSGFSNTTTFTPNNGFTFINFATEGGSDNSNTAVDELLIATTGNADYIALDGLNWEFAPVCNQPAIPAVTAISPICAGGSTTLNIGGALNDATQWHIYTGFCGVTPVGTTTGSTFVVSPISNTTYYIRGEGGCTTPGTCGAKNITVTAAQNASFSYSASAYCLNASDPTPTISGVSGGTFSSSAGISLNTSTGTIDVSASTPGTYTVAYTTSGTCPGSSTQNVTINTLDNASFNYGAAAYCANNSDPTPTISGLPGGSFSAGAGLAINASTGSIDVSASTPGTYTVTYTTSGSCPNSSSVSVTINALDNASFTYGGTTTFCANGADPTATITGLGGGSFSSGAGLAINAANGTIDVSASTPGTYTVTYTTSGACPNSSNLSVTINALDNASFNYSAAAYCSNGTDPTPTISGVAGGTFSSTAGLAINTATGLIDVSASTPGTYTVSYTTSGSCSNSSSVSVTINTLDNASFNYSASSYCQNAFDPTPTITGVAGGTFTSTAGLSINAGTGAIDVSASTAGSYSVTYTTFGTCPASSSVSVTISALDNASFFYSAFAHCVNGTDPTPTISGVAGGTFSSTAGLSINTVTGTVDLSASTPGTYLITYTTAGSCPNSSAVNLAVNGLDNASFNYSAAAYCANGTDPTPTITGVIFGSFSSTAGLSINASTGAIDLSASTPGTYTVTYTTAGACPNSSNLSVTINALDNASFSYAASSYCSAAADPTPTISGLAGGTFSSTAGLSINAATGAIDVSASTPGTYSVTYTTAGSCPNSSGVSVTVTSLDNASFSYSASSYCQGQADPTPTITGVVGGTFTSSPAGLTINPSTGFVNIVTSTPGTYTITYTTSGTCSNSSSVSLTIATPPAAPTVVTPVTGCPGSAVTLTATGSGAGAILFYNNVPALIGTVLMPPATATLSTGPLAAGTYIFQATESNGGCQSMPVTITVNMADVAPPTAVCQDVTVYLDGSGNASITASDLDGGSIDDCGAVSLSASQTIFDCSNIFGSPAANLIITGVYDGPLTGGVPKGVELYVLADIADLSLYGVGSANNGGGTDGQEFTFPTVAAAAGTFIYVASESPQFTNFFGFAPDYTSGSMGINGDDAVELFYQGNVVDVFGDINVSGFGQPWDYLDGWASRNAGTGPDGTVFNLASWSFSGANALDNETTNATAVTPVPVGTYAYVAAPSPTPVTLTVTDAAGNSSTCVANVTVSDTVAPAITCPGNQIEALDASCNFSLPDYTGLAIASDNCGSATLVQSPVAGTVVSSTTPITMTATDASGNSSSCTFNVILDDITPPNVICQNINVYLDGTGSAFIGASSIDGGSTDNCSAVTLSASQSSFTCADLGTNNVTLTATDGNGNSSSCTAVVTVIDTIAPVAICQNITVFLDGSGNASIVPADLDAGSIDNCGAAMLSASTTSFTCADVGANPVTLTATDGNGNSSFCTAIVTVSDTVSPTASCQNITVFLDAAGTASITAADLNNGSADNCSTVTLAASTTAFTCADAGPNSVTLTVTDGSGNTSTCTSTVTVADSTSPTASCQNITIFLDGTGTATIAATDLNNGSTDNCSTVTLAASTTLFTCADLGPNSVTLTVTDGSGNTSTCTSTVTVSDSTSPVAVCQNITVFLDGSGNTFINANDLDGGSVDNCGPVTLSASSTSFTCANIGANPVTLTVTDASGNSAICTSIVTVSDTVSPLAICQNIFTYLDGAGNATIVADDLDGGSFDNCGTVALSASTTAFTCANTGTNNVTLTATDASGNTSTCTAVVTIIDTISPTAVCQNINAYLDGAGNTTIVAADLDGGSIDNCGAVTFSASATTFTCANPSANSVTLTVTDAGGNSSTCTSVVTILDTISPVVVCPGNQLENPNTSCQFTLPDYSGLASASDNCGSTSVAQSPAAGTVISGTTTITMTATDASGNTSTCTFDVILNDATPPTAVCQNINVYLDGAGNATIAAADIDGGSTDNCSGLTFSASQTAFTCANLGSNNVTLTVTDGNSNSSNCVAVVTVIDTIAPVVACPGDQTEIASATCDFALPDYTVLAIGMDNCSAVTLTQSPVAGTLITADQLITITGTDAQGNSSICAFNVILDQTACAGIECSNAIVLAPLDPCGDQVTVTGSTVGGTPSTETFCGTSLGSGGANWYTFTGDGGTWTATTLNPGSNYDTKIWIYEGLCGSLNCVTGNDDFGGTAQSQVSFATTAGATYYAVIGGFSSSEGNYEMTISNVETAAPTVTCPGDQTEAVSATCDFTLPDYTGLVLATDNCGTPTVTQSPAAGTVIVADQVITMTATDAAGNTATCTFNVILTGGTPPLAVCQDVTVYLDASGNATIVAADIDGGSSATCGTPTLSASTTTFTCAEIGTNNVTLTVTDAGGNTDDCIAVVTVMDTIAPTADLATLANVTANCEVTVLTDPTATDNCGTVTVTNDATLPIATQGTTVVTWTYTDGNGNASTQTQNVVINDVSSPLPTAAPLPDVTGQCSVDTAPAAPTAIDACTGAITGVLTSSAFPYTTQGVHVITWTFDDGNGNISTQSQNIVVNDNIAPVANTVTLATLNGDCLIEAPTAPTAADNCSGPITGTTTTVFPITEVGTTTIVWTYDDGNGNTTTQTQIAINTGIDASATLSVDGGTITANTAGATYAWVNCDFNTTIAGQTDQSFTPAANGNYAVIVTLGNCVDTSACITVASAGIDDLGLSRLTVYPNPSQDGYFTVDYDGTIQAIDVVDMLGRVIALPTDLASGTVDGSELAYGRYMVRVTTDKSVLITEILIAR